MVVSEAAGKDLALSYYSHNSPVKAPEAQKMCWFSNGVPSLFLRQSCLTLCDWRCELFETHTQMDQANLLKVSLLKST